MMPNKLLLVLALLLIILLAPVWVSLPRGDEAIYLLQSAWIAEGKLPYRDFFQFVWPGSLFIGAILIKLTGFSIIACRIFITLVLSSGIFAINALGKPHLSKEARFLLALFLVFNILINDFIFSHHAFSSVFAIWSVFFLIKFFKKNSKKLVFWTGIFSTLTLLSTQSLGLLILLGNITSLTIGKKTKPAITHFLAGLLIPAALFTLYLYSNGISSHFWQDTVVWLLNGQYSNTSLPGYFSTGPLEIIQTAFNTNQHLWTLQWLKLPLAITMLLTAWLPILGILWGWQWLISKKQQHPTPHWQCLLGLTLAASLMLLATCSYSTFYHIGLHSGLGLLLTAIYLQQSLPQSRALKLFIVSLACFSVLFSAMYTGWHYFQLINNSQQWITSYSTAEKTLLSSTDARKTLQMAIITEVTREHTQPKNPIFVLNASPEFYILTKRPSATRFVLLYPVLTTAEQESEMVKDLERTKPRLIIDDLKADKMIKFDARFRRHRDTKPRLNKLEDYIAKHYTPQEIDEQFKIHLRNPD